MKALFVNGSPRKDSNTAKMLFGAMDGAKIAGAEIELINLYDYLNSGCKSCFTCKLKGNNMPGLCAINDSIKPLLKKAIEADVLIMGSPVYYASASAQMRAFIERLLYPNMSYSVDAMGNRMFAPKKKYTGLIFTMLSSEEEMLESKYPVILGSMETSFRYVFGHCESLYSTESLVFNDFTKYESNIINEYALQEHYEKVFQEDLRKSFYFGIKLVNLAKEQV